MAIVTDGSQAYAIKAPTMTLTAGSFVVESFTKNFTSTRVDLNDGNGEPSGSVIVPGRVEISATIQVGAVTTVPTVGDEITYDSESFFITEISLAETQADYRRYNISGYKSIN